ncbi:NAD(P)/FAD-dependent oxidoreductase [Lactobacillus sp. W8092]|nr:NAD(P)/FAD-dependent oxidoreductase [Lactobacillus sp. W8092]
MSEIYDVAVIGGGPVGIFTAYYASMRTLKTVLIESMPQLGGQPQQLYPQKKIYDVGGQFAVTGAQLITNLLETDERFLYDRMLATTVQGFTATPQGYVIQTNKSAVQARAIIITVGNGPIQPRKLACDYDPNLEGKQINYFVSDLEDYRDQTVLVAGGGDSAVDWALEISHYAQQTFLLHRRSTFRALESSVQQLAHSKVQLLVPEIIKACQLTANQRLAVTYQTIKTTTTHQIIVDKLLVNYGMTADSRLLRKWQLQLAGPFIQVNSTMHTNLPYIYAAGDAVCYPGKERLITLGWAEGPIAVNSAINDLKITKAPAGHSSSLFN